LDLVIILDGKGTSISRRMIQASQARLHGQQCQDLLKTDAKEPQGNRYSLFSKGMLGSRELVRSIQQTEAQHDYLALANDFIEYCQLEQAMDVLETGITLQHDRPDLQLALLELYKSTKNRERFQINRQRFSDSAIVLDAEWLELANYFEGQAS
jgi:Tfp pilus assembly protein FimV